MSKLEKLIKRFKGKPKDFTYDELRRIMISLGYIEDNLGKTSGSRVCFCNSITRHIIKLHKPHPVNVLKEYQIELILEELERKNLI